MPSFISRPGWTFTRNMPVKSHDLGISLDRGKQAASDIGAFWQQPSQTIAVAQTRFDHLFTGTPDYNHG